MVKRNLLQQLSQTLSSLLQVCSALNNRFHYFMVTYGPYIASTLILLYDAQCLEQLPTAGTEPVLRRYRVTHA